MAEERDIPLHKIKYGRINGWIYRHGPEQYGDYQFEYFRWVKLTPRSHWQKVQRAARAVTTCAATPARRH